jgi:hypothetical protein
MLLALLVEETKDVAIQALTVLGQNPQELRLAIVREMRWPESFGVFTAHPEGST